MPMSLCETVNALLENQDGVYTSDKAGHLLDLRFNPLRVTCITHLETCDRSQFQFHADFVKAGKVFVENHGYLDRKIAENIDEIVQFYLTNKVTRWTDEKGRPWVQDARGNTACIPEPFPVSQELIEDLEKNGF